MTSTIFVVKLELSFAGSSEFAFDDKESADRHFFGLVSSLINVTSTDEIWTSSRESGLFTRTAEFINEVSIDNVRTMKVSLREIPTSK